MDGAVGRAMAGRAERERIGEWRAWCLWTGLVSALAVPEVGGRLLDLHLGDHSFLFHAAKVRGRLFSAEENGGDGSLAAWKNYGGDKTWPAPQGWSGPDEWAEPPDPVLDTGHYYALLTESTSQRIALRMTSPSDPRSVLRLRQELVVRRGNSKVAPQPGDVERFRESRALSAPDCVADRLRRAGRRRVGRVAFGLPALRAAQADRLHGLLRRRPCRWRVVRPGLLEAGYQARIGRIVVDASAGWLAFAVADADHVLAARFPDDATGKYPDRGWSVEAWTRARGRAARVD